VHASLGRDGLVHLEEVTDGFFVPVEPGVAEALDGGGPPTRVAAQHLREQVKAGLGESEGFTVLEEVHQD
jgi:hypothetical protein